MYQKDYSEVIKALETNVDGLSQKQAKERLEQNGYNVDILEKKGGFFILKCYL